ncbi:hypothetical protein ACFX2A_035720 [Malus domestica]
MFDYVTEIQVACATDPQASAILTTLHKDSTSHRSFQLQGDLLYYKARIFVPSTSLWRSHFLKEFHAFSSLGHSGFLRTYKRLTHNFNWPGLKKDVKQFVVACDVCQRTHYETIKPPRSLQPLSIPTQVWTDIAMDFVEGLPVAHSWNAILVVVDHLSKYGHFIPKKHPYTAPQIADIFI